MPLDALSVSTQVRQMGEQLVARRRADERQLRLARRIFGEHVGAWRELAALAEQAAERVAVPTEPLDATAPLPGQPPAYTALATDGSEIDPDRHGAGGTFFLVNIGSARIPYGQPGRDAELRSRSRLGYTDDDLFIVDPRDARRQVPVRDRHLDALRAVEELRALADLAETESLQHGDVPAVALVDGTLLFSVLEERPRDFLRDFFYGAYVRELDRLRAAGVALAAYASRTRGIDLVTLFRNVCGTTPAACRWCAADAREEDAPSTPSSRTTCALRGLTDAHLLGPALGAWERSALFRVRSNVHDPHFGPHRVYFFLLNTGEEVARVEMPEWVASVPSLRDRVHAVVADQCRKGLGYPAVLARADDRAVLTASDRATLAGLVQQELARRGVFARPSAKLGRKQVRAI